MTPKIFIGPMSKNTVDSIIEFSNDNNVQMGVIPSRRQIDFNTGYVNNWTTRTFSEYIRSRSSNILMVRDHGGPNQGDNVDDGCDSFCFDAKHFDVIHVDVWKFYQNIDDGIRKTIEYINFCYNINPNVEFEISTEQSIRNFSPYDLEYMLVKIKNELKENTYKQIKYLVIQCGTSLIGCNNNGVFDEMKLQEMIRVCKKYNMISKEHNGDYQSIQLIKKKFNLGLNAINIAPEFGKLETEIILKLTNDDKKFHEFFFNLCLNSGRWKKWVPENFEPYKNKTEIILISGHYVFSSQHFQDRIKDVVGINDFIKQTIKNKLKELTSIKN